MALEGERTRGRLKIKLPSGDTIFIPVITQISFVDSSDRYQETRYAVNNKQDSSRTVHTDELHPSTNGVPDNSATLPVERIDEWPVIDASDRAQETRVRLDNVTGNDLVPPSFTTHVKTHVYRYYQDPNNKDNSGVWIDSELIDEFDAIDGSDRYQETRTTLRNPEADDDSGQADPSDPDVTEYDDDGNPVSPVRTDPFQNLVNYNSHGLVLVWVYTGTFAFDGVTAVGGVTNTVKPAGTVTASQYVTSLTWSVLPPDLSTIPGASMSGAPTVGNVSYPDWTEAIEPWIREGPAQVFTVGSPESPGTTLSGAATLQGFEITNLGIGFYGFTLGGPGVFGGGYFDDNGPFDGRGTFPASVSGITLTVGASPWTWYRSDIAFLPISVGSNKAQITIATFFKP